MSKLAICVPTVGHTPAVEEILKYSISYLNRHNIDLYYYDSGEDEETKSAVEAVRENGYDNVFYVPVTPGSSFGEKIDLIFSGYGHKQDYEYIWPIKDRIICNEYMLELVLSGVDRKADIIISLSLGDIFESDHVDIHSPVELYFLFAKQITSLETVVYNKRTVLGEYRYGKVKNAPLYQNEFYHYWFLFNKLVEMKDPIISIISKNGAYNMRSSVRQASSWSKRVFEVWIDEWVQLNYELPDVFSPYKAKVIKDTTSIDELLGNRETFVKLHDQGILNKNTFEQYEKMWEYITVVPKDEIKMIAMGLQ